MENISCKNKQIAQKKCREKTKSDPAKNKKYLEKAAGRMKKYRSKLRQLAENNEKLRKNIREKERIRKQKSRERIKNKANEEIISIAPYKTKQSFGKALKKAKNALRQAADKRAQVVKALFEKYVQPANFDEPLTENVEAKTAINEVNIFFLSSDISIQSAGRKDTLIVDGEAISKRFMLCEICIFFIYFKYVIKRKH